MSEYGDVERDRRPPGARRVALAHPPFGRRTGRRLFSHLEGGHNSWNGEVVVLGLQRDFTLLIGLRPEGSLVDLSLVVDHWSISGLVRGGKRAACTAG